MVVRVTFMSSISGKRCVHCAGASTLLLERSQTPDLSGSLATRDESYIVQYMAIDYY